MRTYCLILRGNAIRHIYIYIQREDLNKYLQVLTAIMTYLTADIRKTLGYLVLEGRFSINSFTTVRANHSRTAGSHITINKRFAFLISNKGRKYHPKLHIN